MSTSIIIDSKNVLPVLIIPGIMSSGLEVRRSAVGDKHIGERVWLNPIALGFGKLYFGEAFSTSCNIFDSEKDSDDGTENNDDDGEGKLFRTVKKMNASRISEERKKELECKSAWLQHLSLTSDLCNERDGNEIRPIPGLRGVDFLTEIATIKIGASYVFGPIIKLLTKHGYVKELNLDAVPYDWRLPPSILEKRDRYFTLTMERIEKMYADNNNTPVVLLCHSMGCKAGHYLLNFALAKKGREWIDKHVHTYMPLGAPHLGAPRVIGGSFAATLNPLLDPMLSMKERLVFARSLGSAGWLMPAHLPSIERNAPPTVLCKKEGVLSVEILAPANDPLGDMRKLTTNKHGSREVLPFKVKVAYGTKENVRRSKKRTGVATEVECLRGGKNKQYFEIPPGRFLFPTPATLNDNACLQPLRFSIMELGQIRPHELETGNLATTIVRYFPSRYNIRGTILLVHKVRKKMEKYKVPLAMSAQPLEINVQELIQSGTNGLILEIPMVARTDMTLVGMVPKANHRSVTMKIRVKWTPPPSNDADDPSNPIAVPASPSPDAAHPSPEPFARIPEIRSTLSRNDTESSYVPLSGQALFRAEGLEDSFVRLTRDVYGTDPVGPRDRSSSDRPPVKRTYAIYGINVDTEVSKVCRRVRGYHEDFTPEEMIARPRFEVDTDSTLEGGAGSGLRLEKGAILEHPGTPQVDLRTGERIRRSGDGSVPYYSLQQSQLWAREIASSSTGPSATKDRVRIEELEGAEHREMLSDERFHVLLMDYLTGRTVV